MHKKKSLSQGSFCNYRIYPERKKGFEPATLSLGS